MHFGHLFFFFDLLILSVRFSIRSYRRWWQRAPVKESWLEGPPTLLGSPYDFGRRKEASALQASRPQGPCLLCDFPSPSPPEAVGLPSHTGWPLHREHCATVVALPGGTPSCPSAGVALQRGQDASILPAAWRMQRRRHF